MIALLNNHPALGVVLCCTVAILGLFGYLAVRRVCIAVERCKGTGKVAAVEPPAVAHKIETVTCGRCGQATSTAEHHEIYCSLYDDNVVELRAALTALGYKKYEIDKVMPKLDLGAELPVLIKLALAEMPMKAVQ